MGLLLAIASGAVARSESLYLASSNVDLELLLAVDVSASVDAEEYSLQIHGLADALRHPDVVDAIKTAAPNGVALALMQWAGPREHELSVPWSEVHDQPSAEAFAQMIEAVTRPARDEAGTAIGSALDRGVHLLAANNFEGTRQIIDICGDGRTNQGHSSGPVRERAALAGITVNGLVILNEEPQLDDYYRELVIGGPGAFLLQITDFEDFARAMRMKLILEVAMASDSSDGDGIPVALSDPRSGHLRPP